MSADYLRETAALIRQRVTAATPGPWEAVVLGSEGYDVRAANPDDPKRRIRIAKCGWEKWEVDRGNAEHVAAWHPSVALSVADLFDKMAWTWGLDPDLQLRVGGEEILAVARTYRGETS